MTKAELATDNDELLETIQDALGFIEDDEVKKAKRVLSDKLDEYDFGEDNDEED